MSGNRGNDTGASLADTAGFPRFVVLVDNFFYHAAEGVLRVNLSPHLGLMSLATRLEESGHRVEIFDPKRIRVGQKAANVAFRPDGRYAYVTVTGENKVAVIDMDSLEVVKELPAGQEPWGLVVMSPPAE